jgi:Flp pilus assembly protein TadD
MPDKPVDPNLLEGEKHLDAGDWAQAEAAFRRAIETNPNSAAAHSKLGVALVHQRRADEAERAFARAVAVERAVAADPDDWIAHQNLGGLYKQMGRTSEAIAALKKATRLSIKAPIRRPGDPGPRGGCLGRAAVMAVVLAGALALLLRG